MDNVLIHQMLIGSLLAYKNEAEIIKNTQKSSQDQFIVLSKDELIKVENDFKTDATMPYIAKEYTRYGFSLEAAYYDVESGASGLALKYKNSIFIMYSGTNREDRAPIDWESINIVEADSQTLASIIFDNKDVLNDIYYMALQGRNIQVPSAMKFFDDVKSNNNDSNIYLGGHSLGGGLALTVGIRRYYEIEGVITFNPAAIGNKDIEVNDLIEAETIVHALDHNEKFNIYKTQMDFLTSAPILKISDLNMFYPIDPRNFLVIGNGPHSSVKQEAFIRDFKRKHIDNEESVPFWKWMMNPEISNAGDMIITRMKEALKAEIKPSLKDKQ